jgi:hypothetical protein
MVFVLQVHDGAEITEDQSSQAADRQLKRSQLIMLKENIDVIADNLKSLIQRSKQTGSALFDVAAIESVISEAATLLVLLNSEDEDEEIEEESAKMGPTNDVYVEDVAKIDQMVADIETEVVTIEEKMASAPATADTKAAAESRASLLSREPVTDLEISPRTFNASDPNKRPDGWYDVMMKRVLRREQQDRENGMNEDDIMAARDRKLREVRCLDDRCPLNGLI